MDVLPPEFAVVGIGASAGGLEALEGFFKGLPDSPGAAFVIVTHLPPGRESILPEIIARFTQLPVQIATDGATLHANHVYVAPPDTLLAIEAGKLAHRKLANQTRERRPIDVFLSSLAQNFGEYAASIMLSGADGDGALGTKTVKQRGGLTIAQIGDGYGPSAADMPAAAISIGLVDLALPAEAMGRKLVEFANSLKTPTDNPTDNNTEITNWDTICTEIFALLRNQVGHDFSGYKPRTCIRRVQRRMQVIHTETPSAYIEYLRQNHQELEALFRDLMINVTNFFRDTDAFTALEQQVIPQLFENKGAEDVIRVWIPACATGEEAFSIAILMREYLNKLSARPRVQIFATDIDERALTIARTGRYPEALLDGITPTRRQQYFYADGGSYAVSKDVRDLCIFSPHSVIRDPPFSHIDLISCRNLLIYLGTDMQSKVMATFHYALRKDGHLFLGASENVSHFSDYFSQTDKQRRIFKRSDSTGGLDNIPFSFSHIRHLGLGERKSSPRGPSNTITLRQTIETRVLEQYAPAYVVVTREGDIMHYSGRTGTYLEPAAGAPNRQLLVMARKGLRLDLRTMFHEAVDKHTSVARQGLVVEGDHDFNQTVTVTIEPLNEMGAEEDLFLVVFQNDGPASLREGITIPATSGMDHTAILETELLETRKRLQSVVEEYDTALEELKSSNEELVSVNEELQSSNEEMEASREEMQSLNEELQTVNIELTTKIDLLDASNNDLQNLFESTQVATVFLDKNLVIRSFTPAVTRVFNLLPGDRGRAITDLVSRIPLPGLADDVRAVGLSGTMIERRIDIGQEGSFLVRLSPYRNAAQRVDGVVVSFVDVTNLTRSEAHQRVLIAELNHRVKNMIAVIIGIAIQTRKAAPSAASYETALISRLHAMARSYELLSRENWTVASIGELIELALEPFGEGRFAMRGPAVRLKPEMALSVGMVLHELATNAAKYGAFSQPGGQVAVTWLQDGETIEIVWQEIGGPVVVEPVRRGFGLKLIERETSYNLRGRSDVEFRPGGVRVVVQFSLVRD